MNWTPSNYPNLMANLEHPVREKAIEFANNLIKEGFAEGLAIHLAIKKAQKWVDLFTERPTDLHIVPHLRGWAIQRAHGKRASFVLKSKDAAKDKAFEMAEAEGVGVTIFAVDGKIEDRIRFD
ncbi:MAG: DUF2188 domain-containing protein [Blastochloris sp.]|nr:DUF2188 domain-containing protein [Blastochloris sp.]